MEELIRQVTQRAGISEDQARTAVTTVLGYLRNSLPAGISGQLEGLLGGAGASGAADAAGGLTGAAGDLAGQAGNIVGGLGGMFGGGGKKD